MEVQRTTEIKQFSKIDFLDSMGLLKCRWNYESLEFEKSSKTTLKSYWILLVKVLVPFKVVF